MTLNINIECSIFITIFSVCIIVNIESSHALSIIVAIQHTANAGIQQIAMKLYSI